jgi:transposase, IS5 family
MQEKKPFLAKTLALTSITTLMYRDNRSGQLSFKGFYLPFGGKLSGENRWVTLSNLIPWEKYESEYAEQFSKGIGAPAKPFRMALGALIIKERLGTSDEETVEQIRENPYLQYFLGLSEYSNEAPFEASMMVHFRKRLNIEIVGRINEEVVKGKERTSNSVKGEDKKDKDGEEPPNPPQGRTIIKAETVNTEQKEEPASPAKEEVIETINVESEEVLANKGQLLLDASCAPADIRYPTDLSLLNQAREQTEAIIDDLYKQVDLEQKPRTYRQQARKRYLAVAKQRRASCKVMRKAIRTQLGYVRRNLTHIDTLVAAGASLSKLSRQRYRRLLVVSELHRQQQWMYDQNVRRIDDRIVSLAQPHVRPIVRGKAGNSVEFGAKIAVSCVDGKVFLERLSWDNFNESVDLPEQVEKYRIRFGYFPKSLHVDQIYRTKANRAYCKERGIRISGSPLGRPKKDQKEQAALRKQTLEDLGVRNQIEGKFGQGKRRFSLGLIKSKLAETAETSIAITFLVMNLELLLRPFFVFWAMVSSYWRFLLNLEVSNLKIVKICYGLIEIYLPYKILFQ